MDVFWSSALKWVGFSNGQPGFFLISSTVYMYAKSMKFIWMHLHQSLLYSLYMWTPLQVHAVTTLFTMVHCMPTETDWVHSAAL